MAASTYFAQVQQLYIAYFGRPADTTGLNFWAGVIDAANGDIAAVQAGFSSSTESQTLFGNKSNIDKVTAIYLNTFGRQPEAAGLTFWVSQLETGKLTQAQAAWTIQQSAGSIDAAVVQAKLVAAQAFTAEIDTAAEIQGYQGVGAADAGRAFLATVVSTATGLTAVANAPAALASAVAGGSVGTTFTLTAGIDNLTGDNGNNTIVGAVTDVAGGTTIQSGDVINGGAGTDTLRIVASNATTGAQNIVPTLSGVENVEYQGFGAVTNTLNLTTSSSVEKVSLVNGNSSLNVTNAASIVDVAASNTTGGALNVAYTAAAVAGTADVQAVSLNNTVGTSIVVNGVETFNIAAEGANTAAAVAGNAVTTVNVSGAGSLALTGAFAATTTTFNASANTGGVSATFAAGGNVTATGGTGNDSFNFLGGLTATDVVNGGEGTDTVRVTNEGNLSAATATTAFNALTSVERVAFDGAGVTLNGSTFTNAAVTNIEFNTSGNDVIDNAGSARTYEFGDLNTGSATFNLSGGSNVLNLALLGTVGTAAANDGTDADVGAIAVNLAAVAPAGTLATINISSLGDLADVAGVAANFNNVGAITAVAGSTINITGAGNLDLASLANRGIIDASKSTGNLVLEGSEFTSFVDVATPFVSGADVITLGTGQATIQFSSALDSGVQNDTTAATTALGLQVDTISGFKAGANGDVLDFTPGASTKGYTALTAPVQAQIDALSGAAATLQAAADFAVANTTADTWAAFSFQGQTYAVYDAANPAGAETYVQDADLLVQLSGVSVAALTAANFA